jgi:hypothetical protein
VGIPNSAHERNRPSLLDFLFSDLPLPAAIIIVVIVVDLATLGEPQIE